MQVGLCFVHLALWMGCLTVSNERALESSPKADGGSSSAQRFSSAGLEWMAIPYLQDTKQESRNTRLILQGASSIKDGAFSEWILTEV